MSEGMGEEHDDRIGRVMSALRTAEPPAGMERRIVARLEAQADVRPVPIWGWVLGAGMAAMVLAGLMLSSSGRRVERPMQAQAVETPPQARAPEMGHPANVVVIPTEKMKPSEIGHPEIRTGRAERREQAGVRLVSYPAPAEPLTAEEKLLRRIARDGDHQDFALLNPETREQAISAEEAEFESFLQSAGTEPADTRQNQ